MPRLERAEPESLDPTGQGPRARLCLPLSEVGFQSGDYGSLLVLGNTRRQLVSHWRLQGDVAVLPWRHLLALRVEHAERLDQAGTRVGGFDDVVDEPSLGSDIRVAELPFVLGDQLTPLGLGVGSLLDLPTEDDV